MSERSRPDLTLTRRSVLHAAAMISAAPAPVKVSSVTELCLDWLRADVGLEALTLEWSQAEAVAFAAGVQSARAETAAPMQRLERQIARIDRKRSVLLDRIVATPAGGPEEAVGKLLVAKRLLEGEGGAEHDIVEDAVMRLAAVFGWTDDQGR